MDNLKMGKYKLQVSSIGFETKNLVIAPQNKNIDLGIIELDSSSIVLNEVVVTASTVINHDDHKVILPTSAQIKGSSNGFNLLQQLGLQHIQVDIARRTVTASGGGEVQLRINGVKATIQETVALRPEDILRIEHYEDPGVRYQAPKQLLTTLPAEETLEDMLP